MPALTNISAIVFYVKDLERTQQFYQNALGLDVAVHAGHDGSFATAQAGNQTLVFLPADQPPGHSPVIVFGLDGGIDDVVAHLAASGAEIVVPVSQAPDGGWTADFRDPNGHTLSVYQSADIPR